MKFLYLIFLSFFSFVLLSLCSIKENISNVVGTQSELYTVSIYLNKNLNEKETSEVKNNIQNLLGSDIKSIQLISIETQINDVLNSLPSYASGLVDMSDLKSLIGPLFEVELKLLTSEDKIEKIKSLPLVQQVSFSSDWIRNFEKIFNFTHFFLNILFFVFLCFTVFFTSLLTRSHLIGQQQTLLILTLHGASPGQILGKYFYTLLLYTFFAYALGVGVYSFSYKMFSLSLSSSEILYFISTRIHYISNINLVFVGLCILFTLFISFLYSLRYVVKKYFAYE